MNKNRLIRSALCLVLAFAMTFAPIFSSYAIIAAAAGTGEEQATELENTDATNEADQDKTTSDPEVDSTKDQQTEEAKAEEKVVKEEKSDKAEKEAAKDEEKATKTEYVWKDDKVKVTATLADADAIPDDAKLVATAIDKKSQDYNYKAYMDALNKDSKVKYDESNTLLYDIAFIKDGVELQPESGKVSVAFDFLDDQLKQSIGAKKAADVNVIHLPLVDEVKDQYDTTADAKDIKAKDINVEEVTKEDNDLKVSVRKEKVIFELESFSATAIINPTTGDDGVQYGDAVDKNSQVNYNTALGRAVEYGILADTYYHNNHTETNWAVNHYIRVGEQVTDPDLATNTGNTDTTAYPYLMAEMTNKLRFGQHAKGTVDVYLPDSYAAPEYYVDGKYTQIIADNNDLVVRKFFRSQESISNDVNLMMNKIRKESNSMIGKTTIVVPDYVFADENPNKIDKNNFVLDTTSYADDDVIYVDVPAGSVLESIIATTGGLKINKHSNQVIVFNFDNEDEIKLNKIFVHVDDAEGFDHLSDGTENINGVKYLSSATDNSGNESNRNDWVDSEIVQKIIWNANKASTVRIDTSAGLFLAPNASKNSDKGVIVEGSSAGWLATTGYAVNNNAEWHFIFHARQYTSHGSLKFEGRKEVWKVNEPKKADGKYQTAHIDAGQYTFSLYKTGSDYDVNGSGATLIKGDVANTANSTVQFPDVNITDADLTLDEATNTKKGTFYYVIKENLPEGGTRDSEGNYVVGDITYWTGELRIRIDAEEVAPPTGSDGVPEIQFKVNSVKTYSNGTVYEEEKDVTATTQVFTFGAFPNEFTGVTKGIIQGQKKLTGREFEEGDSFTFTVTGKAYDTETGDEIADAEVPLPDPATKTINPTSGKSAGISFNEIQYSQQDVGRTYVYTVTETGSGRGIVNDAKTHTVTMEVSDDETGKIKLKKTYSDTETNSLNFVNTYQAEVTSEQLQVKKQVTGKPTQEEFTFKLIPENENAKDETKVAFDDGVEGKAYEEQVVKVTGEGTESFKEITFKQPGTYKYTISEIKGSSEDITYDESQYDVTIVVIDDGGAQPKLEKTVSIQKKDKDGNNVGEATSDKNSVVFVNDHISNELKVKKVWKNADGEDITASKTGSVNYKLIQVATPKAGPDLGDEKTVNMIWGQYDDKGGTQTEQLKENTVVTLTVDNPVSNTEVRTYPTGGNYNYLYTVVERDATESTDSKWVYHITVTDDISFEVHTQNWTTTANDIEFTWTSQESQSTDEPIERPYPDNDKVYSLASTSSWEDEFTIVASDADVTDDHTLPKSGTIDDVNYDYTYKVVEVNASGEEITDHVTYTNNSGVITGEITIENTTEEQEETGSLTIRKTFAGNTDKLSAADKAKISFTVSGPEWSEAQTVNYADMVDGVWTYEDIKLGEYTVEENVAEGKTYTTTYKVGSDSTETTGTSATVDVGVAGTTVEFTNTYTEGGIKVVKTAKLNGTTDPGAEGQTFIVALFSDATGTTQVGESKNITIGANGTGETTFDGLTVGTTYYVFEMNGASKAENGTRIGEYTVVTGSGSAEATADISNTVNLVNNKNTGTARVDDSVTITKKDQAGAALNGAEFKLYADEGLSTIVDSYTGGSFDISTADETLASYLPTENGGSTTLYLKETAAPAGYTMDTATHPVVITTTIATAYDSTQDKYITTTSYTMTIDGESVIDVTNRQKTGEDTNHDSVTITKKDQNGGALSGAEFKLYKEEGLTTVVDSYTGGNFTISTRDAALASYLPTTNNGSTTLYLKETKAPSGYEMDTAAHPVVITTSIATDYDAAQDKWITTTTYTMTIDNESAIDVTNTKKSGETTIHDSVTITKKDQDGAPLGGAEFELYQGTIFKKTIEVETGGSFVISTEDEELAPYLPTEDGGSVTLHLKETKAPEGYDKDTTAHPVVITTRIATDYDATQDKYITTTTYTMTIDGEAKIDVTNTKKTGEATNHDSVKITKKDQDGAALNGATFNLYSDEACTTSVKTYGGGEFSINTNEPELANYLPTENGGSRTLYLKETAAPAGYAMDTLAHPVVITTTIATAYDATQDKYITTTTYEMTIDSKSEIDVTNTKKTGEATNHDDVTITKKDQDGEPLDGATFNLYSDAACTASVKAYSGGEFTISTEDRALASYLPTANNGSTTLYLKETAAPAGYNMDTAVHPVVITTTIATAYDSTQDKYITTTTYEMTIDSKSEIDVTNTKKTDVDKVDDSVTITKKDQDGAALSGAEFKLYADEGLSTIVDSYTGGSFTISTEDTALASYLPTTNNGSRTLYLKETKAPSGYEMDTAAHPVTITAAIATAYNEQKDAFVTTTTYTMKIDGKSEIDVTNTKKSGETTKHDSVTITKKDQDGEPLSGAEFELYKQGTIFKKTIEVETGGSFVISTEDEELAPYLPTENGGTVTLHLKETKAPAGYNKDTTEHPVVITTTIDTAYDSAQDKYITTTTYTMTIDSKAAIDVTNTQKTDTDRVDNSVTITKKDQDGAALNGATFNLYSDADCTASVKEYSGGEFSINTNETELANYLPTENGGSRTLYLKETAAPANYEMDQTAHPVTITTSIATAYNAQKDAFVTTTTYSISIDSSSSASIFNNRETGKLEVTKTIVGKDTDKTKTFNFVVTLDDETINTTATKTYGDMEFVNGVANISLRDGQSMTASNLPTGIGYTVVETLNDDSCMLVKSGDTGTISKETKSVARFKNCFAYGEIQFSGKKTFEHGDISKTPFSFKLYKKDGNDLTLVETVTSKADGTIEFTKLEYTLADLKNGTSYDTTKVFNYVIKEVIPDTADDTGYDAAADIQYDTTEYLVAVTVTRNDTAALSVTADKQTTGFNFANSKKYTYLKLTKNTPELVGGDTNGEVDYVNATMVFKVTYDEVVGTDIIKSMTRYVDVAYKASTKKAQVRYLDKIPYGATVTVEEVYSGNYSPDGNKPRTAQYDKNEGCYTVTFNNTLNRSVNGSGVINKISKNGDKWKIVNRITNSDEDPQQPPGGNDQQPKNDQALPQTGEQEVNTEEDDGEE